MMFYMPSQLPPGRSERLFQHTDLTPTLIDMLRLGEPCCCFGSSALRGGVPFHVVYYADRWTLTLGNGAVFFDTVGKNAPINGAFIGASASLEGERMESTDPHADSLLRGILQQYNSRMLQNKLVY